MVLDVILNPDKVISDCLASAFHIEKYDYIIRSVADRNFKATEEFRKTYNGFFRVRSRTEEWYDCYFRLLEEQKEKQRSFSEILKLLYACNGKVEVSFASKLIAVVNPTKPIWDKYVIKNFGLEDRWRIANNKSPNERMKEADSIYNMIAEGYCAFRQTMQGKQCIDLFDTMLPEYKHISDIKKLDFFIWSKR